MPRSSTVSDVTAAIEWDSREMFALAVHAMDAADLGLAPTSLRALLVLDEVGECSLHELADHLTLSQSATSRMVDGLVNRGLVRRQSSLRDRRQLNLSATPSGRRATAQLVRRRRHEIDNVLAAMNASDRDQLWRGLAAFAAAARSQRAITT